MAGVGRVKIAGTVVAIKERITRTGSRMAWVRISDAAGSIEVTCFSEVLNRSREDARVRVQHSGQCGIEDGR